MLSKAALFPMNPGVVSLRCPACARPFLSLPQQRESLVTCPHCRQIGTAGNFVAAGKTPGETLVQSLRHRILQPGPSAPSGEGGGGAAWPAAPPLFSGRPRQPPLSAEEPQWPFIEPESETSASPFGLLGLDSYPEMPQKWVEEPEEDLTPHSERNVPLGVSLLVLVMTGVWLLWLALQPPLAADIPAVEAPRDRLDAGLAVPLELEAEFETVRRADLTPQP